MNRTLIPALTMVLAMTVAVVAATVPFTEDFVTDSANWRDGAGAADLQWAAAGGPDGGSYAFSPLNFLNIAPDGTPLFVRAQDEWNSSGGAFVGNYIAENVEVFRVFVRHDAPAPLTYFVRFASPNNFPAANAVNFAPVLPQTWTEIVIPIDPNNPQFVNFEGTNFEAAFSNIGHIQVGVFQPSIAGQDIDVDFCLDKASITGGTFEPVPALSGPGMLALIAVLGTGLVLRFGRRPASRA